MRISRSIERMGKRIRIAELRAEYSAWRVDSEISDWRNDFHKMGQPPSVRMYPVRDLADDAERSGSLPCKPAKSAST